METMKVVEGLATRGGVDQWPNRKAPEGLMAAGVVAYWKESGQFGFDQCYLRPALQAGQRAWLITRTWTPAMGYGAEGTQSDLVSFEEGMKLLEEKKDDLWFPQYGSASRDSFPDFDFERHKALEVGDLEQVFWHEEPAVVFPTPPKWRVVAADDLVEVVWKRHPGHGYWYYPLARVTGEGEEHEIFISLRVPDPDSSSLREYPAGLFVTYAHGHDCDRPGPWRAARKPAARTIIHEALLKRVATLAVHVPALVSVLSEMLR